MELLCNRTMNSREMGRARQVAGQVNKSQKTELETATPMQASAERIWTSAQQFLRSMLTNSEIYSLWFAPLRARRLEGDVLTLDVANEFCEVWLKDNYEDLLRKVLA